MGFFDKILGRGKIRHQCVLALDIGTEFVKALIVGIDEREKKGEIIGAGLEPQKISHMVAGAVTDIHGVAQTSKIAIESSEKEAGIKIDQAVIGIAGEFIKGVTLTFSCERKNPKEKIELTELKNIIQKIQWKAYNKIRADLAEESGISEIEVKLINATIIDVRIDGYQVTNPLGFQGREVTLSIFNAYAPLIHLGALNSIAKLLGLEVFSIAAEPYAISRAVEVEHGTDAIFIDIGGGTSDIALVRQGGLEGIKSLALGGRSFTKRLADNLAVNFAEAEQIKLKYSQGEVSSTVKRKITEIFRQDIKVWLSGINLALSEFSQLSPLPSRVLLCGGGSCLPGVKKALESEQWVGDLPMLQSPQVSFIQPQSIANIKDKTGKLTEPRDVTPLALASLSLELLNDHSLFAPILRRAIRLMQS
ncbi:MAG: rod shape-determining protein [Candidatus Portnoybacteria bacterium]|nr:rod shape-determining protein [Candidatus Portnoybacteria bacterium]